VVLLNKLYKERGRYLLKKIKITLISSLILGLLIQPFFADNEPVQAAPSLNIIINEVAWMGTTASYNDEWLELYNNTSSAIDLSGWTLKALDGSPAISLSGSISAGGYYLLERTDDNTVSEVNADLVYTGALGNSGETLELRDSSGNLIDSVDAWYAGDNTSKATMERIDSQASGTESTNWVTSTDTYTEGYGTPRTLNSESAPTGCFDTKEHLNNVSNAENAINIYFNKCAFSEYATTGNEANYNVNLEDRLIARINAATSSIDFATYEINLPKIVDALINRAANGVSVRVIADAKDADDPHYTERYETMRLYVEKMVRGLDGKVGTSDDIHVFSDSAMLAVEDSTKRTNYGLPASPDDFPYVTITVGSSDISGYFMVDAEQKTDGSYYSPGNQMHNKFAIIDGNWVFTGSWNFTVTGLYGTEENMQNGILGGNSQHVIEINSSKLSSIYKTEFDEMWGSTTTTPDPTTSNFSSRKTDNTLHILDIGGRTVEVYFSPGDDAVGHMTSYVKDNADYSAYFTIFAWSDQSLVDELKFKWEGSYNDLEGNLTGFDVQGVFDESFWNQWWSASVDMTGRTASQESTNNPNTRWANPAPVYSDMEDRKLHSKTMLIDATYTDSDPTVIVGSTNWSNNGNAVNDENMLFIHDATIVNQFLQEYYARYEAAGGEIPAQ
jgi:phosphatidylserine/phosphatidylglycerophosphate/cardiolipin synthase-like enzyme